MARLLFMVIGLLSIFSPLVASADCCVQNTGKKNADGTPIYKILGISSGSSCPSGYASASDATCEQLVSLYTKHS